MTPGDTVTCTQADTKGLLTEGRHYTVTKTETGPTGLFLKLRGVRLWWASDRFTQEETPKA